MPVLDYIYFEQSGGEGKDPEQELVSRSLGKGEVRYLSMPTRNFVLVTLKLKWKEKIAYKQASKTKI